MRKTTGKLTNKPISNFSFFGSGVKNLALLQNQCKHLQLGVPLQKNLF